ncbi:MAG: hypothetical protein HY825_19250 [Acidobacteria bacterium]|nr:hypothetical protein [Acidobacteriota bacterium]
MIALLLAGVLAGAPAPRLGADVLVEVPTAGTVVSLAAQVRVSSVVDGDVVAVAGDVELLPGAEVRGDVIALGGAIEGPGVVSGRTVEFAPLGWAGSRAPSGSAAWGLALLRVGGWLVLGSLLTLLAPGLVRRAAAPVGDRPWVTVTVGVLGLAVWLAVMVLLLAAAGGPIGILLALLGVAGLLALKVVGIVGLSWWLGRRMAPVLPLSMRAELPRTALALLLLAVIGMIPLVGASLWAAANVAGIGAAVRAMGSPHPVALALSRVLAR